MGFKQTVDKNKKILVEIAEKYKEKPKLKKS